MTKWKYTYDNGQVVSRGHATRNKALWDALEHLSPGEFTDPVPYEEEDTILQQVPVLKQPGVTYGLERHEQIRVVCPLELREKVRDELYAAGFNGFRLSGPVTYLSPDHDPDNPRYRFVVYRVVEGRNGRQMGQRATPCSESSRQDP